MNNFLKIFFYIQLVIIGVLTGLSGGQVPIWFLLIPLLVAIYLLPTIIASVKEHPYKWLVFWINLFLGFTGIAWIILLIWAIFFGKPKVVKLQELNNLTDLRDKGVISEEDYQKHIAKIKL